MNKYRFDNCPCCKNSDLDIFYKNQNKKEIHRWQDFFYGSSDYIADLIICKTCGYYFINSLEEESDKFYKVQEIESYNHQDVFRIEYFKKIKKQILDIFPESVNAKSILDIGAANGLWLDLWRENLNLYASEYSSEHIDLLKMKNINVITPLEIGINKFDIISLFDVLEHVNDPLNFLKNINNSMHHNSIMIIGVPNMGKLLSKLLKHKYYLVCPMHYSYFNKKSLTLLFSQIFPKENIIIKESPYMNCDLQAISKWITCMPSIPTFCNFKIPILYSASLIVYVKK